MLVKDIMSENPITVDKTDTVKKASLLMRQYDIGILPVLDGKNLIGVVTDRDIVTRAIACCDSPQNETVESCMSKSTVCTNPTQNVTDAAKTMAAQQIRRVPVVENGQLCGMLSLCDISKNGMDTEVSKALCEISKP